MSTITANSSRRIDATARRYLIYFAYHCSGNEYRQHDSHFLGAGYKVSDLGLNDLTRDKLHWLKTTIIMICLKIIFNFY